MNGTQVNLGKRLVDAGSGYNAQNDMPVHFAVPEISTVYLQVRVRRPGRQRVQESSTVIDLTRWRGRVYEMRLNAARTP